MTRGNHPAFPMANNWQNGLTKREWFAGMALLKSFPSPELQSPFTKKDWIMSQAISAVQMADCLIAELERNNK